MIVKERGGKKDETALGGGSVIWRGFIFS